MTGCYKQSTVLVRNSQFNEKNVSLQKSHCIQINEKAKEQDTKLPYGDSSCVKSNARTQKQSIRQNRRFSRSSNDISSYFWFAVANCSKIIIKKGKPSAKCLSETDLNWWSFYHKDYALNRIKDLAPLLAGKKKFLQKDKVHQVAAIVYQGVCLYISHILKKKV